MGLVKPAWLTAAGQTPAEEVAGASAFAIQATATGNNNNIDVELQGSIDGVGWAPIETLTLPGTVASRMIWVSGKPVKYIRISVLSANATTFAASVMVDDR